MIKSILVIGSIIMPFNVVVASSNSIHVGESMQNPLPGYVSIDDETLPQETRDQLRVRSETVEFPLSPEDQKDLETLCAKYDSEKMMAGLAAPQIGINKRMIIFAVPDTEQMRAIRKNLTQFLDRTVWINPSFEPLSDETTIDMEGCFSVKNTVAKVERFHEIRVIAKTPEGKDVDLVATGFLARVIQHEIDHVDGVLFVDRMIPGTEMNKDDYIAMRMKQIEEAQAEANEALQEDTQKQAQQ